MQQYLFEIDDNIHLNDAKVGFEKTNKGLHDKASHTYVFNNTQEADFKRLTNSVKELKESCDKNKQSYFTDHVIF